MKRTLLKLTIAVLIISCNRGPRVIKVYDAESDEYRIDTLPYNDLRDFPKLQKTQNIDSLVNEIKKEGYMFEKFIGFGGAYSEQYARFERITDLSSEKELFNLTKNENPVVKIYAYKGLKIRKSRYLKQVYKSFENDTTSFSYGSGCMIGTYQVNEYTKLIE